MNRPSRGVALIASLPLLVGCGDGGGSSSVSGKVLVGGQPMPPGVINFFPSSGGRPIGIAIDESGTYDVDLPPGEYTVVVKQAIELPDDWQEGDPVPPPPVKLPGQYTRVNTSPLELTVEEGESITRDFELD